MLTIDAQVHAYEHNHPGRPWVGTLTGPAEVTGDQMVAAMDAVGVDGAILVSPFSMYRYDASYAKEVYAALAIGGDLGVCGHPSDGGPRVSNSAPSTGEMVWGRRRRRWHHAAGK